MISYQTQATREANNKRADDIMAQHPQSAALATVQSAAPKPHRETPLEFRQRAGDLTAK